MTIQHLLVIDDDPLSRAFLVEAATAIGFKVSQATGAVQGLELARTTHPDLVLTDLRMPVMDGIELVQQLARDCPALPVVLVTAHGSIESAVKAMQAGAVDFLLKPVAPEALELVLRRVARLRRLEQENHYLRQEYEVGQEHEIIAESASMHEVLESARRIARSKGTVLITGESGTGKERVASYIHRESPRREGPFIRVNCAALSETLLESELFGHERGAFTGAHKSREGRFELADGGTLLLDEIGEISPALQSKLLRVLEEEEFERVGGTNTLKVDVRVIATTNRALMEEVSARRFREDLYYRLHVLPVHIEPLSRRADDILPLARHFVAHFARQSGLETPQIDELAVRQLQEWRWPGNVRELENVIQRAVVLLRGDTVRAGDLVFGPGDAGAGGHAAPLAGTASLLANRLLADIEREAILATLECTGGNKTEAARRMGVTARTLSNKMKAWRQAGLVA